jgi:NAD kinase
MYEKIVVVKRKTRLEELIERFSTREQAKFYINQSGGNFEEYVKEHDAFMRSFDILRRMVNLGLKLHIIDREFLPTFMFNPTDVIVVFGQDGLVANAAKYVGEQPILGVNPDPSRFDGILVPILVDSLQPCLESVLAKKANCKAVTLAEVVLNDEQKLLAFNDLFIGAKSHISARYHIKFQDKNEDQSSSGLIVSTGAGSTGWLSSLFNMASNVNRLVGGAEIHGVTLPWDSPDLMFVVREPFISRHSTAKVGSGILHTGQELVLESLMPSEGTIFSDGIENDFLAFNSGTTATIRAAKQKAQLILPK